MPESFAESAGSFAGSSSAARGSVIADDLVIDGTVTAKGAVEIRGQINGDVEGNEVVVGTQAKVRGDIRGGKVEINGNVEGDISGGHVLLSPSAFVKGAITCRDLIVQSGATMDGHVRREASEPPAPDAQAKGAPSP